MPFSDHVDCQIFHCKEHAHIKHVSYTPIVNRILTIYGKLNDDVIIIKKIEKRGLRKSFAKMSH